jgi:Holliday junction resolvase RusA-like endonuclease
MNETILQRQHIATFRADGMPKGQPRPRAFSRGGRASVYDPGTAEGWKSCVAVAAKDLRGGAIHSPLSVTMTFYLPRPKSHYRSNGALKPTAPVYIHDSKPDADNLAKAVLDALTTIQVWQDDDQVCELTVRKYWEQPGTHQPGCVVRIQEMQEVES